MAQQPQAAESSSLVNMLVGLGIAVLMIFLLYSPFKTYTLFLAKYEFQLLSLTGISYFENFADKLTRIPASELGFKDFYLANLVNLAFIPFVAFFIYKANIVMNKNLFLHQNTKRKWDAISMADFEVSKVQHYLKPVWKHDLLNQDPKKGRYPVAKKPHDIAIEQGLFKTPYDASTMIHEKTDRYFATQLGKIYTDEYCLEPYHKALLGIFMAAAEGDSDAATKSLKLIAISLEATKEHEDFSSGVALFEKYKNGKLAKQIHQRHAYINTLLAGAFYSMKKIGVGVLPSYYFIWLKEKDRVLFYALNNIGRSKDWAESAGIITHMFYEISLGRGLVMQTTSKVKYAFQEECQKVIPKNH